MTQTDGLRVLVTGAGGFIGHHLVGFLKRQGYCVRGIDLRRPRYGDDESDEFHILDLRESENGRRAAEGIDEIYALAAGRDVHATPTHA